MLLYLKNLLKIVDKKPSLREGFFISFLLLFVIAWFALLEHIHYQCPFLSLFHLYCPGCGGTRMVISMLHFDFYQAFRWNPLMFIVFCLIFIYIPTNLILYKKKKVWILPSTYFWIGFIIILILYMILRNIPAFEYLIPTEV